MEVTPTFLENLDRLGAWGVLTTDEHLQVVGWNRWLERHTGKTSADVSGRHLFDVFPDLVLRNLDHYYREALGGQAALLSQRFHSYLLAMPPSVATSHVMHMQQTVRISPLFEAGGIRGTLTLIEDVTERVVTELDLRQQAQRLEEANRHKDEFLAMLAHELRNPLAPIRNGIRLLGIVGSDNVEARQTREMIERQVSHMVRLVDDLLDVSRIMRGKIRLKKAPCDLAELVAKVAHDNQSILADNGVDLFVDLPSEPCWMLGDSIRITQIVSNLLHNAGKFTDRGGEVHLRAAAEDDAIVIRVADTGVGMSAETQSSVFESFSQAETTLDRSKGGLGLGLALVKGLAELHGGSVNAFSRGLGLGSEFTVRLPLPSVAAPAQVQQAAGGRATQGMRVLLIEDNRDAANTLKRLLMHSGVAVELAFSGTEGLEAAKKGGADVVICDIGLPGLNGFEIARALRSDASFDDLYLIALSGYGQPDDVRQALDAGFNLHLIKPVDFSNLMQALEAAGSTRPSAVDKV